METIEIMSLALVEFLSDKDLIELAINADLLESTRRAAQDEIDRREQFKTSTNDV